MEYQQSDTITTEVPSTVVDIFNSSAEIIQLPEGGYKVKTTLESGIAEGGQQVEIEMGAKQSIEKYKAAASEGEEIQDGYKLEAMKVNGINIIQPEDHVYLLDIPD